MVPQSNPDSLTFTLLGTGTSTGIPVIGCVCPTCTSDNPKDRRLRCSCLVTVGTLNILIDAGPDFRYQALRAGIRRIDAVLFTHSHFDHVCGIDDLWPFLFENDRPIPCFGNAQTCTVLEDMFPYIFRDRSYPGVPSLDLVPVDAPFRINGRYDDNLAESVQIVPIPVDHGNLPILGFRMGPFAYVTDTNHIPESSLKKLDDLEVLVLDALRHKPHPTHLSFAEATAVAEKLGPKRTHFIHMTHSVLHTRENKALPANVTLGFDGLSETIQAPAR